MKKFLALALAVIMVLALSVPAWADGTNGKITVENATVGVTYKAYKILDATYNGDNIAYTTTAAMKDVIEATGSPFTVSATADSNGNYAVTSDADAATISAWITANQNSFTAISATSGVDGNDVATANEVVFSGLNYGYYFVTSGLGSVLTIDSVKPEEIVKDKNTSTPTGPDKEITAEDAVIDDSDQTGLAVEENDAAVGTIQSFSVTYNATNWVTTGTGNDVVTKKVTKFYIDDQPTNMTIDPTTVAVTVGTTSVIAGGAVVDPTGHPATVSVATGDAGKLEITIDWVNADGNSIYPAADGDASIPVTLTYDALVLPGAATQNADNTVTVKYDRDGEPKTDLGEDNTETYTYHFTLTKTDKDTDAGLKGAKFELTLGSTKVSFVDVHGDGSVYRVAGTGETGTTTIDMKENSSIEIQGLDKQDYTLTEIEAPKGYNLLTTPVDVEGDMLKKADQPATEYTVDVDNAKGTELPSTGGIGTTIFYVLGGLLVVFAGVLLITKTRMSKEQ